MFRRVLIANRGEIAGRILRTLRRMDIASVAVYSDADRFTQPVMQADEAVRIGPDKAALSYLDAQAILAACRETGADAVHPGYGFLSENADFAEALEREGIRFIGPQPSVIRRCGLKHEARMLAAAANLPLLPGSALLSNLAEASAAAAAIGYPVMLKSTAGGGGVGMRLCRDENELTEGIAAVKRLGRSNFGDGRLYLEKFIRHARHVEVQIFGDGRGGVVALGERDCSLQRRNQKVIEETPAPGLSDDMRGRLHSQAVAFARSVSYESAGTVEFIYDAEAENFYFLEVNTRLQVEHGVTEAVYGIDLVEWMIRQAAGKFELPSPQSLVPVGAAIEARLYAENPSRDFEPSSGLLTDVRFDDNVRVDGWIETGSLVTPFYDPLLAKLIASGPDRSAAIEALAAALAQTEIWGVETNLDYLRALLRLDAFATARMTTATLAGFHYEAASVDVLEPGTQSSLQDWPGRLGYWNVGVPPSGPMDNRSLRLANRIVGNAEGATALEMTLNGPMLRFNSDAVVALAGARMVAELDGQPVQFFQPVPVRAGQTLAIGAVEGPGVRTYLAVRHGFAAPLYLGSRATFALGGFGGHAAGLLRTGDTLRLRQDGATGPCDPSLAGAAPELADHWTIGVLLGPHAAPDFFTDDDIRIMFEFEYRVHHNSARTGVRLVGPKPTWARLDGGEAGLHPSNIHDNAYAVGAIDFTGDMPIILGPDGPSLGGFVCPAVVVRDELWKLGQLGPGARIRFRMRGLENVTGLATPLLQPPLPGGVLRRREGETPVCYRVAGSDYVLVEYGALVLDIVLRLRVHALLESLRACMLPGIIDLTPAIRSLQIHYDPNKLSLRRLLDHLERLEGTLPATGNIEIPSRIVHLPLCWDDEQARLAMQKYQDLVRPDAPWNPSNIEFIRRINGLESTEDVQRIVFDASYLVLGLGDVYLGAPVATPLDPRHRLVTTKYNPARTWTPQNAVGIGGAYLCVYGMEGPGGYQLIGRTIQVWNSWRSTPDFEPGCPWLLRFFDQIRFHPVSHEELEDARLRFPHGHYRLHTEDTVFQAKDYQDFLERNEDDIACFRHRQRRAFEEERRRWKDTGQDQFVEPEDTSPRPSHDALPSGCVGVESGMPGSVWKFEVVPGQMVRAGDALLILESMKMEMRVAAPVSGRLERFLCQPGQSIVNGQRVAVIATGENT